VAEIKKIKAELAERALTHCHYCGLRSDGECDECV
jgi:hypothetical protein